LEEYWAKMDFTRTPEPRDGVVSTVGDMFGGQEHHASRLHWDLRLERDGFLKSQTGNWMLFRCGTDG